MRIPWFAAVVVLAGTVACKPHRLPDFAVTPAAHDALAADILNQLEDKYVVPERAAAAHAELARRWATDEFRHLESSRQVCQRVTDDLRQVIGDGHLFLLPAKALPPAALGPDRPLTAAELDEQRTMARQSNFGVRKVDVLDGNLGYIDLVGFPTAQLPEAAEAVKRAMDQVADTRALIFDLRDNHGGDGDTVAIWMSYLLDRRTLLLTSWDRTTGKTSEDWTPATVAGRRYGAARPVWVLTSHKTFSAGEELAYDVKTLGRGAIVGETTGGGANHNMFVPVGGDFVLSVSFSTTKSPVTGTNWEGVGVKPDVEVAADRALDTVLARARATSG